MNGCGSNRSNNIEPERPTYLGTKTVTIARQMTANIEDDNTEEELEVSPYLFLRCAPDLTCRMFIPQTPMPAAMIIIFNIFSMETEKDIVGYIYFVKKLWL